MREISFDFTNFSESSIGEHGVSEEHLFSLKGKAESIHDALEVKRNSGLHPFRDLPYENVDDICEYAEWAKGNFENFVNIGIGGSALGAQALVQSLCHPFQNMLQTRYNGGMRMFFADNIDPDTLQGMFDVIEPEKTLYNVITKSGTTAETMGTFLVVKSIIKEALGSEWKKHVVATTDHNSGDLRKLSSEEGLKCFDILSGVGGRFSVFTPVGLLPAACAGIDIRGLLEGAEAMDKSLKASEVMENPAYLFSMYQHLLDVEKGKPISVMMPYSSGLHSLADWFRQLWAESLGKKYDLAGNEIYTGPTPVKALGVTDQHSQVQLYVEGPYDKVFTILAVKTFHHDMKMEPDYKGKTSLDYLGGRSMAELMEAERLGTVYALTKNNRPNMTITFPEIIPETIGEFMYALEVSTVFSGGLYNIDPLDQPGVEAGKIAAFALMGRPGYEDKAQQIRNGLLRYTQYVK